MGKTLIASANLGDFDSPSAPVPQDRASDYYIWTDANFPPITGLTPRLQYRVPKTHAWQMKPEYDYYVWLDGGLSFENPDCATYYYNQLDDADIAFFAHPNRNSIKDEALYIDDYLHRRKGTKRGQDYLINRYKNGGHLTQWAEVLSDETYTDNRLFHSGTFIYRNTPKVQDFMKDWLYTSVRHFTCDQIALPWLLHKHNLKVNTMNEPVYNTKYLTMVSRHG